MASSFSKSSVIILIGYMGSGKSTVGRMLAQKHNLSFQDLDDIIANNAGTTIPKLFVEKGAKAFRALEHEALKNALGATAKEVISLGGGAPCYYDNINLILDATPNVFYLKASHKTLAQRLFTEKNERPLIAHAKTASALQSFIAKHLFERQSFYNKANHQITVDDKSIEEVVTEIGKLIQ